MKTKIAHLIYDSIKLFVIRNQRTKLYGHCKTLAAIITKEYSNEHLGNFNVIDAKFEGKSLKKITLKNGNNTEKEYTVIETRVKKSVK